MSGTVKLIGDRDIHWDDEWGYEDHAIATRLIGREDIYWDVDGTDELGSFFDRTGTERPITLINASHIPLPTAAREACEGADNVSSGMQKLSEMAKRAITHSSMSEDTTIEYFLAGGVSGLQEEIDKIPKDLGGHTLSVIFPAGDVDIVFQEFPVIQKFFNGSVEIDLKGSTISDIANIGKLIHVLDCSCKVEVKGGTLKHAYSPYGIQAERSPHVYMTNVIFHGSGAAESHAFYGIDSDGNSSGCVYSNDKAYLLSGLSASDATVKASSAVSTHDSANDAHATLFAGKEDAGTASSAVSTHNSEADAHATLLASIMPPGPILPYAGTGSVPAAFLLCDGQAVSRETYSALFAAIGITYGGGDGVTTFNVPDFRGMFLRGYDDRNSSETAAMGTKQNEGLPNITGTIPGEGWNYKGGTSTAPLFWDEVSGAFRRPAEQPTVAHNGRDGSADVANANIEFDASECSSIYGASSHVTPVNYAVQYIIKT